MKIKMMNKESQKALNFFQVERLKSAYTEEWKDTEITSEDLSIFASLYTGTNGAKCLKFSAEMCFNHYEPNVWCEAVFVGYDCYVEAGFCLTDAWESDGKNGEELRKRAYIRRFELVK